jgi:hypothetical protein
VGKRRANSFLLVGMGGKRKGCKPFPTYGGERGEGRVVNPSYLGWGKEGKILSYLWVTGYSSYSFIFYYLIFPKYPLAITHGYGYFY